jgi:hypothetical protein
MKVKILAGLVTALIYGGAAMAQDVSDTQSKTQGQQSPDNIGGSGLEQNKPDDLIILDQQDVAPVPSTEAQQDQGVGGSGPAGQGVQKPGIPMQGQGGVTLYCTPVNQQATGGSGQIPGTTSGNLEVQPPPALPQEQPQSALPQEPAPEVGMVPPTPQGEAFGGSGYEAQPVEKSHKKADMTGVTVLIGGGVEGYTGALASKINLGETAGALVALKPSKVFGLELGYNGAINNLDTNVPGNTPDIVRNSAQADVTLGLTAAPVQPYVLGGYGMNWYNVRNGQALGFHDDTNSKIPVGLGLRTHIGAFTADARVNYNFLISDDFAPATVDTTNAVTGSYNGTINLGGTF